MVTVVNSIVDLQFAKRVYLQGSHYHDKKKRKKGLCEMMNMLTTLSNHFTVGFLRSSVVKQQQNPACQCRRSGFEPWVGKTPWRRAWQPTPVFFPGESPWTEEPVHRIAKSFTLLSDSAQYT